MRTSLSYPLPLAASVLLMFACGGAPRTSGDDADGRGDASSGADAGDPSPDGGGAAVDGGGDAGWGAPDSGGGVPSGHAYWSQAYYQSGITTPTPFDRTNGGVVKSIAVSSDGKQVLLCGSGVDRSIGPRCLRLNAATGVAMSPSVPAREGVRSLNGGFLVDSGLIARVDSAGNTTAMQPLPGVLSITGIAEDSAGRILTVAKDADVYLPIFLQRLTTTGGVDSTWPVDRSLNITGASFLKVDPTDRAVFAFVDQNSGAGFVRRVLPSGLRDSTFGMPELSGSFQIDAAGVSNGVLVLSHNGAVDELTRYTDQGTADPTFGQSGTQRLPSGFAAGSIAVSGTGAIYVGGTVTNPSSLTGEAWVLRLSAQGQADSSWGSNALGGGTALHLLLNNVAAESVGAMAVSDGRLWVGITASPRCYAAIAVAE